MYIVLIGPKPFKIRFYTTCLGAAEPHIFLIYIIELICDFCHKFGKKIEKCADMGGGGGVLGEGRVVGSL